MQPWALSTSGVNSWLSSDMQQCQFLLGHSSCNLFSFVLNHQSLLRCHYHFGSIREQSEMDSNPQMFKIKLIFCSWKWNSEKLRIPQSFLRIHCRNHQSTVFLLYLSLKRKSYFSWLDSVFYIPNTTQHLLKLDPRLFFRIHCLQNYYRKLYLWESRM